MVNWGPHVQINIYQHVMKYVLFNEHGPMAFVIQNKVLVFFVSRYYNWNLIGMICLEKNSLFNSSVLPNSKE